MNLSAKLVLVISSTLSLPSWSAIGCMTYPHGVEVSEHTRYQPVSCSCPCQWTDQARGECHACHHFGDPNRGFKNVNQDLR